jgi:hypothetical protein
MLDGATIDGEANKSFTHLDAIEACDPIAMGIITGAELRGYRQFLRALNGRPTGVAEFSALRSAAILNGDVGFARRGSIPFWWLVAWYEICWVERRGDQRTLPHESAAAAIGARGSELWNSKQGHAQVSALQRNLAQRSGDRETLEYINSYPREERRRLLLDAWRASRPALRAFLAAVQRYQELRAAYEDSEVLRAATLPDLGKPYSVETLWHEYRKAEVACSKATEAARAERQRVCALYPPCPVMGSGGDACDSPASPEDIKRWRDHGQISSEQTNIWLTDLERWEAACRELHELHTDFSLIRAHRIADARCRALYNLMIAVPTNTLSEVLIKLRFVAADADYPIKQVLAGLIKDLGARGPQ